MNIQKNIQIALFITLGSTSINGFWLFKNENREQKSENSSNQASDKKNSDWLENLKTPGSTRLQQPKTAQELEILQELENEKMRAYQDFLQNPTMRQFILQQSKQCKSKIQELTTMFEMFSKLEKAFQPNANQKTINEGFVAFQDFLKLSSELQQQQKAEQQAYIDRIQPEDLQQLQILYYSFKRKEALLNSDKPNLLKGITALTHNKKIKWLP